MCVFLIAVIQLANLLGENPSFAFSFETTTTRTNILQCGFRESFRGSNKNGRPSFRSTTSARIVKFYSKPEEYDDGIGDIGNSGKTNKDGEDLVAEFYKTLREREDGDIGIGLDSGDESSPSNKATKDGASTFGLEKSSSSSSLGSLGRTSSLFGDTNDYNDREEESTPTRKFTGSDYFGGFDADDSSPRNAVRENMMRREYELVSGATSRNSIAFQAGLAVCMLAFFLYVGLTGGIVTGDAAQVDYGGDDMIQFQEIIPIPRDSDNSVWI